MATPDLSVIIITKNEAPRIRRCLESVRFASEIIVLDSGSTDNTVAICQEYTDKVYTTDWPGFGLQKNRALEKAQGQWVLAIDADEWADEALCTEIMAAISANDSSVNAFAIPRRTKYLGYWVYHGDVGRDKVIRLFRRGQARFSEKVVHENLVVDDNRVGQLKHHLYHDSYRTIEELQERMNTYTTLSAQIRYQNGKRSSLTKAVTHAIWAFVKAYFVRGGFLDGRIGFIVAVSSAESSYYRYLKLLWLEQPKI
ncbi:MAG TPA: glycosyltransferase family 2 protein [Gammaproteobacteria bacterium]|nr:glycosyltransferase family 2 protein [Gammaproteobacteria bacterium]